MANNTKHITEKYVTGKGELTGFIALVKPSTTYNKKGTYTANILLSKEEGEVLTQKIKEVRTEQFKTYGKGTKVAELPIAPYEIVDPETGEASTDPQGRYLLKTSSSAYIENGKIGRRIQIVNAKKQPVKNINIGEGTIARLGVVLSGYSVAGKTGVSAKVGLVQIINLVEFSSGGFSLDGLDEEEGFEGVGEEFTEDSDTLTDTEEVIEDGEGEEADF
jgi:hypothetical protein